jgi:transposase
VSHLAANGQPTSRKDQLSPGPVPETVVDGEVLPRAQRRRFSADYKRRLLQEADQCHQPGQIGALLRREGLYSSHLSCWRQQREQGALSTLKRDKPAADPAAKEVTRLQRENARLQLRLKQAETIIAVQKKLCTLLGLPVAESSKDDSR